MRRFARRTPPSSVEFGGGEDSDEDNSAEEESSDDGTPMKCVTCKLEYRSRDAGTCKECYEVASKTEEELKRENEELKAKINFLRFWNPLDRSTSPCFSDVVLVASNDKSTPVPVPVPANRAVLASRSPVFKAMLENEMEESLSGTIKISDVSYDALHAFVNYLYTADASLDEHMACDLLVLAEKYQVKQLKTYCEKFLISKLKWENSLVNYVFAHRHNAENLRDVALTVTMENMDKVIKREEYKELLKKDPMLVAEMYEAYLCHQVYHCKQPYIRCAYKCPVAKKSS